MHNKNIFFKFLYTRKTSRMHDNLGVYQHSDIFSSDQICYQNYFVKHTFARISILQMKFFLDINNSITYLKPRMSLCFPETLVLMDNGSVASKLVLVSFERYWHPKNCTQKSFPTFFSCVSLIFPKYIEIFPQGQQISSILGITAPTIGKLWVLLNHPYINIKEKVCPRNVWMRC